MPPRIPRWFLFRPAPRTHSSATNLPSLAIKVKISPDTKNRQRASQEAKALNYRPEAKPAPSMTPRP